MFSNIIGTSFVPKERFPLSPGEIVSLPLLESFCKSKGLIVKRCKSACFVRLGEYSLSIYSNGTVGRCYVSGGQEKVFSFDEADLVNFFWKNFAVNCLKKKGED